MQEENNTIPYVTLSDIKMEDNKKKYINNSEENDYNYINITCFWIFLNLFLSLLFMDITYHSILKQNKDINNCTSCFFIAWASGSIISVPIIICFHKYIYKACCD